ncbi:MAG: hypothetical protein HC769_21675 [Cyanobacteria bacterium CRU_2_1]|nr:hypothetical protein [Cyanobacteria bacterium CRU_2_1]
MNTPEINLLTDRRKGENIMNRYAYQVNVVRTETRINWGLLAQDIRTATVSRIDRAVATVQATVQTRFQVVQSTTQTITRRLQVAAVAAAVGVAIAIETYKTLA